MDDLEAVRKLVEALTPFERPDQERIVRWALEKLGITVPAEQRSSSLLNGEGATLSGAGQHHSEAMGSPANGNIKSFVAAKNPSSDNQFAATVAYFYAFDAPQGQKKDSISSADLQEACRQSGRSRLGDPGKTLRNAHDMGYLDKAERGTYKINTVGENLVAMSLPVSTGEALPRARSSPKRNGAVAKKSAKRAASKVAPAKKRR